MRKLSSLVLLLLILGLAPLASAEINEVWTTYYDCAVNEVGWRIVFEDGTVMRSGQQSGAFRHIEVWSNGYSTYTSQWYQWNGSSWVAISGPPNPTC